MSDYSFSQQQKDFLKLQFRYGTRLKEKLDAGEITQDYYDNNIWLATQQLESPYVGFAKEFVTAVQEEDLQWLANQVGESLESIAAYLGKTVSKTLASAVAGAASGWRVGRHLRNC